MCSMIAKDIEFMEKKQIYKLFNKHEPLDCSDKALPIMLKLSRVVGWPVVDWWPCMSEGALGVL